MASATAQVPIRQALPTVQQNPDAAVMIYDGDCRFCTGQVARLARWDGTGKRLAFISLHDPLVQERWPDLTHEMLMEQMYVVDPQGNRYGGAAAFRYITRLLPRIWVLAPLLHLPFTLPIWQWGYRQVAKRRYKIAGKTDACDSDACQIHLHK